MATRFVDPNPIQWTDATTAAAGGTLNFYESESTTPLNVYSSPTLGTSLGASVDLDASGRPENDIWLAVDEYRVVLKDSVGATVWTRDFCGSIPSSDPVALDPTAGTENQVYSTDGVSAYWRDVSEVPDQTGQSGKYLGTDGTTATWTAFPAATTYDEDTLPGSFTQDNDASGSFTIGNIRVEWGNDTAPTSASVLSTKAVTFHTAFSGSPYYVGVTPTSGGVTSDTPAGRCSAQALSANSTGFTASLFAGAEDEGNGSTAITSTVAFNWLAIGPK